MQNEQHKPTPLERRLKRLDFLAKLLNESGFENMADEISSIQLEKEVKSFYEVLRMWLL